MHPALSRLVLPLVAAAIALQSAGCVAFEPIREGDDLAGDRVGALRRTGGIRRGSFLQDRVSATRMTTVYRASAYQKRVAKKRYAEQREKTVRTARKKGARYVAVPVPKNTKRKSSKGTRDVMVLKADTGEPVNDNVYEVKASPMNDSVISVGGHDALLFSGYQGI